MVGLGWVGLIGLVGLVGLVRGGVQQATGYFLESFTLKKKDVGFLGS